METKYRLLMLAGVLVALAITVSPRFADSPRIRIASFGVAMLICGFNLGVSRG